MSLSGIRTKIETALSGISGLEYKDSVPSVVNPPVAFPALRPDNPVEYDFTAQNASLIYHFYIEVLVNKGPTLEEAQEYLDIYLQPSGSTSVKAVVEAIDWSGDADVCRVTGVSNYGPATYGGIEYLGARLNLDIWTPATPVSAPTYTPITWVDTTSVQTLSNKTLASTCTIQVLLDDLGSPEDNTDLNASSSAHGLLPKLSGVSTEALLGDGTWGTAGVSTFAALTDVQRVVKSADQTLIQNSTVLQDVTEMLFAVGANEVWYITFHLFINSGAVPDFKMNISVPAGATYVLGKSDGDSSAMNDVSFNGYGVNDLLEDTHALLFNGANAGTVQLQAAQNIADASDTKVLANSFIIAYKLA